MSRPRRTVAPLSPLLLGLGISPRSVEAVGNYRAGPPPEGIHIVAGPLQRRGTLVCLGVALDPRGATDALVTHRLKEAEGAGWKWTSHVVATHIPLGERAKVAITCFRVLLVRSPVVGPHVPLF